MKSSRVGSRCGVPPISDEITDHLFGTDHGSRSKSAFGGGGVDPICDEAVEVRIDKILETVPKLVEGLWFKMTLEE